MMQNFRWLPIVSPLEAFNHFDVFWQTMRQSLRRANCNQLDIPKYSFYSKVIAAAAAEVVVGSDFDAFWQRRQCYLHLFLRTFCTIHLECKWILLFQHIIHIDLQF